MHNQDQPGINGAALRLCNDEASRHGEPMQAAAAGRQRTPAEIAAQLGRDATSLTLTGANFEKDKAFYDGVATTLREAAALLARWQPQLDAIRREHERDREEALCRRTFRAVIIAATVRDLLPPSAGEPAVTWRAACSAIHSALLTLRTSPQATGILPLADHLARS